MSLPSKLGLLALAAVVLVALNQWDAVTQDPREQTQVALRQFANSDAAAEELRLVDAAKHWRVLAGFAGLVVLASIFCGEHLVRWCQEDAQRAS